MRRKGKEIGAICHGGYKTFVLGQNNPVLNCF